MKVAIWFLVGFGLLLMIASNFFGGVFVLLLGLAMISGGLFLGFRPGGILRKERNYGERYIGDTHKAC